MFKIPLKWDEEINWIEIEKNKPKSIIQTIKNIKFIKQLLCKHKIKTMKVLICETIIYEKTTCLLCKKTKLKRLKPKKIKGGKY